MYLRDPFNVLVIQSEDEYDCIGDLINANSSHVAVSCKGIYENVVIRGLQFRDLRFSVCDELEPTRLLIYLLPLDIVQFLSVLGSHKASREYVHTRDRCLVDVILDVTDLRV